jgi:hypothetical protein
MQDDSYVCPYCHEKPDEITEACRCDRERYDIICEE